MRGASFGSLLRDPLVLGLIAADITKTAAGTYSQMANRPDSNDIKFSTMAQASGQRVPSLPNPSVFAKIGLGPKEIQANPFQLAQEDLAIGEKQKSDLDIEYKKAEIARMGRMNTTAKAPVMAQDYVGKDPSGKEIWREVPKTPGTIFHKPAPEGRESVGEYIEKRRGGAKAVSDVALEAYGNMDAADDHKNGGQWYDTVKGEAVRPGQIKINDARHHNDRYVRMNVKGVQEMEDWDAANKGIDQLIALGDKKLVPVKGLDPLTATAKVKANAMRFNWNAGDTEIPFLGWKLSSATDPDLVAMKSLGGLEAMRMLYSTQHRYANTKEFDLLAKNLAHPENMSREAYHDYMGQLRDLMTSAKIKRVHEHAASAEEDIVRGAVEGWLDEDAK